ncbi:uncharacterized protein LOC120335342 isoform X2 [Styela clava]
MSGMSRFSQDDIATNNEYDVYGDSSSESEFGNEFYETIDEASLGRSDEIYQTRKLGNDKNNLCSINQELDCDVGFHPQSLTQKPVVSCRYESRAIDKQPQYFANSHRHHNQNTHHELEQKKLRTAKHVGCSGQHANKIRLKNLNDMKKVGNKTGVEDISSTKMRRSETEENASIYKKNIGFLASRGPEINVKRPTSSFCGFSNQESNQDINESISNCLKLEEIPSGKIENYTEPNKMDALFVNKAYACDEIEICDSTQPTKSEIIVAVEDIDMKFDKGDVANLKCYEDQNRKTSDENYKHKTKEESSTTDHKACHNKKYTKKKLPAPVFDDINLATSNDSDVAEEKLESQEEAPKNSQTIDSINQNNVEDANVRRRLPATMFQNIDLQLPRSTTSQTSNMQYESRINDRHNYSSKKKILERCRRCLLPFCVMSLLIIPGIIYICFIKGKFQSLETVGNNHIKEEIFSCALHITNVQYMQSYINATNKETALLTSDLENRISTLFQRSRTFEKYFIKCDVVEIEKGSVIALLVLTMREMPNTLNSRHISNFVKRETCTGAWKNERCAGEHFIGKYKVVGDSSLKFYDDGCANSAVIHNSKVGFFSSSGFHKRRHYRPRQRCEWIINAQAETLIRLTFKQFETERYYDVLSIYKGVEEEQQLVARCNGYIVENRDIFIPLNNATLLFTSDSMLQKTGFFIVYHVVKNEFPPSIGCLKDDYTLTASSGGFTSFGYPIKYPNKVSCKWIISMPNNKVIAFHILDFRTQDYNDAVRIFTSNGDESMLFETLYGNVDQRQIQTNSNLVVVIFTSDAYKTDRGFHIEYSSTKREESGCGGGFNVNVSPDGKVVSTMNYPNKYDSNAQCTWQILAFNATHAIRIQFLDFYTELQYDILEIYQGIGRNKTVMATFSGSQVPATDFVVPSSVSTLRFTSDSSVSERGFRAFVTSFAPGACPGEHECGNATIKCISQKWICDGDADCDDDTDEENCESGCGSSAEVDVEKYLVSQFYPENYAHDLKCEWRVRTHNVSKIIILSFIEFATEQRLDELTIFDGTGRNKSQRAVYSGNVIPPGFESTGSDITIAFKSDGSVNDRGFNISIKFDDRGECPGHFTCFTNECLNWTKVCDGKPDCRNEIDELNCPSGCGKSRELANVSGHFTSQNYPGFYSDNLNCEWRIYSKRNHLIQLEFDTFDTEKNFDKLLVFRGVNARTRKYVGYYSGNKSGSVYRSRYHQISIVFTSDESTTRSGFNISYKTGPPQTLKACPGNSYIVALGMESGEINDGQISASSAFSQQWKPSLSRLNNRRGAWISAKAVLPRHRSYKLPTTQNQWIQIDLLRNRVVTGIVTQGFNLTSGDLFVTSFSILFRKSRKTWREYREGIDPRLKVFKANIDGRTSCNIQFSHPFAARYLRIIPRSWTGQYIVMRMEILGCSGSTSLANDDECGEDDFECGDGTCISRELICDKNNDCDDKSDEVDCAKCRSFQFKCGSGECILRKKRCDGSKDCSDATDEMGCSRCHGDDFQCHDESMCLKIKRVCDEYKDCDDFSDERNCSHSWLCPVHTDYKCSDSSCETGINLKCNGFTDCDDSSDENDCDCGTSPKFDSNVILDETLESSTNSRSRRSVTNSGRFPRIVGGMDADIESWPWQVSIEKSQDKEHFCGGALISNRFILTAAHCLVAKKKADIRIKLGLNHLTETENTQSFNASRVFMHPRYDAQTYDFDIALIEIDGNATLSDRTRKICLPPSSHIFHEGQSCWITGWGTTSVRGRRSETLQEARVELMTNDQCNRPRWYAGKITPRMICAGDSNGSVDSCQGDSGGPLVCQERGGKWFVAGIVSWGNGCGVAYKPGVYTRMTEMIHWVEDIME